MTSQQAHLDKKQVTIVSLGIHGIFDQADEASLDQSASLLNTCLEIIESVTHYHGGKIVQFTGKNALLVFEENSKNPEKRGSALETALEVKEKLSNLSKEINLNSPLEVLAGIYSGSIYIGNIGTQEKKQVTVIGDAVDLASKIREMANIGQILVGPESYKQNKNGFDFQVLEPIFIKGKPEPLPVFKLLQRKKKEFSFHSQPGRTLTSIMVGRARETEILLNVFKDLIKGKGGIFSITGIAGVGKSRLLQEMRNEPALEKANWLVGRAMSHGQNISFHPLNSMIRSWAGIKEEDSYPEALKKLENTISGLKEIDPEEIFPFIATMLGLPLSGENAERFAQVGAEAVEKIILKNLRELLISISKNQPTVIVIEDLHWADQSTIVFIESLLKLCIDFPILFLILYRPGYIDTGDRINRHIEDHFPKQSETLTIDKLSEKQSGELMKNLLKGAALPESVERLINKRTGGNPFFIEEILRSFIDDGIIQTNKDTFIITGSIHQVNIPETIQDVIISRVGKLDKKTKDLLDTASVMGRNFYFSVLEQTADTIEEVSERLEYLKQMQLIQEENGEDELEYIFKHALAHQATYESIVLKKRKELHLKIASSIEKVFPERISEFYSTLAMHYLNAENYIKAEKYLILAGEEALHTSAYSEAIVFFKDALNAYLKNSGDQPDSQIISDIHEKLGHAYLGKGRNIEAVELFNKVLIQYGLSFPDGKIQGLVGIFSGFIAMLLKIYFPLLKSNKKANELERRILDIFYVRSKALYTNNPKKWFVDTWVVFRYALNFDLSSTTFGHGMLAGASMHFNWTGISMPLARKMLTYTQKKVKNESLINQFEHLTYLSLHNYLEGNWQTDPNLEEVYQGARKRGDVFMLASYLFFQGRFLMESGMKEQSEELANKLKIIADEFESDHTFAYYFRLLSMAKYKLRLLSDAIEVTTKGIEFTSKTGHLAILQILYGIRARTYSFLEDPISAQADLKEIEKLLPDRKRIKIYYSDYLLTKGVLLIEELRRNPKDKNLQKHLLKTCKNAIKHSRTVAHIFIESQRLMGNTQWLMGKKKNALHHYSISIKKAEECNGRLELSRTYFEVGKRMLSNGDHKLNGLGGEQYLEKARTMFTEMGLDYDLAELERFTSQ